jgi:TRAP-type C4-dicarboxylate transport system permease large subunit
MRTIGPFYSALGMTLVAVTYVPAFSLWLPHVFK